MSQGGGFCERHGPFDAPHRTCPFCALEADQRRAYGPPSVTVPSQAASPDVKRDIPEPPPAPGLTELIGPEEVQPQNGP